MDISARFDRVAGASLLERGLGGISRRYLSRELKAEKTACYFYHPSRISFAQTYPFVHYRRNIKDAFGVGMHFRPVDSVLENPKGCATGVDHFLFQPWFTADQEKMTRALDTLKSENPEATIDFVDTFAHSDLRLGKIVNPYIRHYFKKSVLRDKTRYFNVRQGYTNLEEYACETYGLDLPKIDLEVPKDLISKLRFSPNFFTAPRFWRTLVASEVPPATERQIDIHARMDVADDIRKYYRQVAFDAASKIPGNHVISDQLIPLRKFMAEMADSKLCLSPFGYGEICWRDIEAVVAGAVLIKPDMSHMETSPEIYEAGETYLPVQWDYSDLEEVMRPVLEDADFRRHITQNAWTRLRNYLVNDVFLDDIADVWEFR